MNPPEPVNVTEGVKPQANTGSPIRKGGVVHLRDLSFNVKGLWRARILEIMKFTFKRGNIGQGKPWNQWRPFLKEGDPWKIIDWFSLLWIFGSVLQLLLPLLN